MATTVRNTLCALCVVIGAFLLPEVVRADDTPFTSAHNAEYTREVIRACAQALVESVPADTPAALMESLFQLCLLDNGAVI